MSRYIRYKYQKQQINFLNCDDLNKWIDTCQTRIVGFDSICSTSSCNCKEYATDEFEPIIQYKKLNPNYNYECLDGNRHYRLLKQISYDNGISWVDTNEYQIGDVYEENSPWCTADEILIDWFEDRTECDGTDEYKIEIKRVSLDGGNTWTDMGYTENGVTTYETRRIIIDKNTCNCGAIGCDNYIQFRFSGTTCSFNVNNKSFTANTSNSVAQSDGTYIYTSNMRDLGIGEVTRRDNIFSSSNILNIYSIPYMLDYTKNTSLSYAFDSLSNVETIQFNNFNTSEVVNMNSMFYNCTNLKTLDLSSFDTSKVTNMGYMFANCENLTNINISNWNTPNLNSMDSMFYNCSGLTSLDLSSFNTSNVYTVTQIFRGCTSLQTLDVNGWNVSGITSYGNMFKGCTSLQELYIGDADDYTYNWWCSRLSNANLSCDIIKVSGDTGTTPSSDTLSFAWSGDASTQTYYLNGTRYTATTNPYSTTLSDLGVNEFTNAVQMFSWGRTITAITSIPDTSNVTDMGYMFQFCSSLTELDLSNFNTSNVASMYSMFQQCSGLNSLDLSNFDTSNVTDMSWMFSYCTSLQTLDLSNFDTSSIGYLSNMFNGCSSLTTIDVSSWDVNHIISNNASNMFKNCTSLQTLKVKSGTYDWWCERLTEVNISCSIIIGDTGTTPSSDTLSFAWSGDTTEQTFNVNDTQYTATTNPYSTTLSDLGVDSFTSADGMFHNGRTITAITSIPDTSNVTNMSFMFNACESLTSVDVSTFDTSNVTNMIAMFQGCRRLTSVDVSSWNTSNVTNMSFMFNGCESLTSVDVSNFDTSKVTYMGGMFQGCRRLTSVDVSNFDTSKVTDMSFMFNVCDSLTSVDVSNFDTSNVTDMSIMFSNCRNLTSLDLSSFNTYKVTNMRSIFSSCSGLTSLDVSSWNIDNVTSYSNMFQGCTSLQTLKVKSGTYDWWCERLTEVNISCGIIIGDTGTTPSSDTLSFAWSGDASTQTYYLNGTRYTATTNPYSTTLSDLGVNEFTNAAQMFSWGVTITAITSIPDTSNVTDMSNMFSGCRALTSLDLSNFNTSKVTDMYGMFQQCNGLNSLDLSNFDTSNVTDMSYMFENCSDLSSLNLSTLDTSKVTDMSYMFENCGGLTSIDLSTLDTSKVTDMSYMFYTCRNLTSLDVSNLNIDNVTSYSNMFQNCDSLNKLIVKNGTYDWWCARLTEANISCDIIQVNSNAGGGIIEWE